MTENRDDSHLDVIRQFCGQLQESKTARFPRGETGRPRIMNQFPDSQTREFALRGDIAPLVSGSLAKAVGASGQHVPTRPMGGWLMTFGKIGPHGGIVPTVDRDGHTMEAAKELGHIDWSGYLTKGVWNDTHTEVKVGVPTVLEFHDETTELSKAHRKVGFWTAGHLFDRNDPDSWGLYTKYEPTPEDLDKADFYWDLAQLLKGTPRPLGFSAHGEMALSPCGKRIIFCKVTESAVCQLPKNPDSTAEPMRLGQGTPLDFLRKGMIGADVPDPCKRCECPAGACLGIPRMAKAVAADTAETRAVVPEDLEGVTTPSTSKKQLERLTRIIVQQYMVSEATAERWIRSYLAKQLKGRSDAGRRDPGQPAV